MITLVVVVSCLHVSKALQQEELGKPEDEEEAANDRARGGGCERTPNLFALIRIISMCFLFSVFYLLMSQRRCD